MCRGRALSQPSGRSSGGVGGRRRELARTGSVAGSGGGHVALRVRRLPRSVFFEVEDDGPGLPSADAPIFDPFYSTKPQGTGLGLAIVHRIVTDHAGDVVVESRPGRTVFRITLPLESE